MADWNPSQYLAFADERTRPAADLIARMPGPDPRSIVDLGCGPGNSTALLRQRFPTSMITGIDASPAMIERARSSGVAAVFQLGDAGSWTPLPDVDVVFSNALFQWIPDHLAVLKRIFSELHGGAVLAIQMPDNLDEPSHRLMREVAAREQWSGTLADAMMARSPLPQPRDYLAALRPLSSSMDIWRTTYHHEMRGHQGIIDMLSSTGLKPFLDPLDEAERAAFLAHYKRGLAEHYPSEEDGMVLLPFPRLFITAKRKPRD